MFLVLLKQKEDHGIQIFFTNHLAMRTNLSTGSPSSCSMCRTVFKFLKKKREKERERDGTRLNTKQTVFNSGRLGERGGGRGKKRIQNVVLQEKARISKASHRLSMGRWMRVGW